ncbi:hypothetical protein GGF31_005758 [Allomyces arbusculus]|nr:hypothetical protein GGF31_005758 [Allomyces arbusculus]
MFTESFIAASIAAGLLLVHNLRSSAKRPLDASSTHAAGNDHANDQARSFSAFQTNYVAVFVLVHASDWLFGPYLYAVYLEHGLDLSWIAALNMIGFLSSGILGSFIGSLSDKWGRKRLCLLYPVVMCASCLCIQSSSLPLLVVGRLFGGVSTALLYSVFEAWMTSEFFARGYPSDELGGLFSVAMTLNSGMAILAGLLANFATDLSETSRAPFLLAMVPALISALVIATTWNENYGRTTAGSGQWQSLARAIRADVSIVLVGTIQGCFESAMFGFVCLYGPALDALNESNGALPFGIIFATFMVFSMAGSSLCGALLHMPREPLAVLALILAFTSLLASSASESLGRTFFSFCVFEMAVGLYFPAISALRSRIIPDAVRGTAMSVFQVPLNLLVVTVLARVGTDPVDQVLQMCAGLCVVGLLAAVLLHKHQQVKAFRRKVE